METDAGITVEDQLARLFRHLDLPRAHMIACNPEDFHAFARTQSHLVSSLTLVCPTRMSSKMFGEINCPLLVFNGAKGSLSAALAESVAVRPDTSVVTFPGYVYQFWSDVGTDWREEIGSALLDFLGRMDQKEQSETIVRREEEGQIDDIIYRVRGTGPPLVLLPLALAPSQWDPLLPILSQHYCTITLRGKALGFTAMLERRGRMAGYLSVIENVVRQLKLSPGEEILDVGCGSGVLMRWLARQTDASSRITAIDINRHVLREAKIFAKQEQVDSRIQFREGSAERIPFPDNTFDVTVSFTVIEEVDADRAIAEMVRVTKPGGRVAIVVRSVDIPHFIHLPLPVELKAKLETPGAWGAGVGPKGCADASLYDRLQQAGLAEVKRLPQFAVNEGQTALQGLEPNILPLLNSAETAVWRTAVANADRNGSFFHAFPYHGAAGSKL